MTQPTNPGPEAELPPEPAGRGTAMWMLATDHAALEGPGRPTSDTTADKGKQPPKGH